MLPQEGIKAVSDERLPAVKRYKAHVKLIPGSQPMFCKARTIPLPLQDRVKVKLEAMVRQGILEPVQPGGVTNASPVVWQRKKNGSLRLCVGLKVHFNGRVMDEDYPIPDMESISIICMGPLTLEKLTYQTHTIKLNWTRMQKKYAQSTHRKNGSRCAGFLRAS